MKQTERRAWEKLREVIDPGANLNVVDMGLISELSVSDDGVIDVVFRPSSPVGGYLPLKYSMAASLMRMS